MKKFIITNISELLTLAPLHASRRFTKITKQDLGIVSGAWIAIEGAKIAEVGKGPTPPCYRSWNSIDAGGGLVTPGLIDVHTHPVFSGSRANEFCMRLEGKTYQDIAAAGGGIQSTVNATAYATDSELIYKLNERVQRFISHGVTTFEAKSGYGLTIDQELRHLRLLHKYKQSSPVHIYTTCLALHAVPKNETSALSWSRRCASDLLPLVAKEKIADAVDAFIEIGYFTREDVAPYLDAAKKLGLNIRLHADEFTDSGAASLAAKYRALSADHLQYASDAGIRAMADSEVVAVLLPGTSLYTSIPYTSGRKFADAGCAVAVATDFNPGSCPLDNIRLAATLAALHCNLTMAEAISGITWVAAKSLNQHHCKGALVPGMDADLAIFPLNSAEEFIADMGRCKPQAVIAGGQQIF